MLTIFVLPYQQDGSDRKQDQRRADDRRSDSSAGAGHDHRSDAARRDLVEPAATDPPAHGSAKKDPRDDQFS